VVEVPIIFTDRTEGTSKMSTRIFREAFLGVIEMTVTSWFKRYDKPKTQAAKNASEQSLIS
jgi:dolichol-phosphate mannosyltransferase